MKDLYAENGDQGGMRSFPLIFSPRIGINYSPFEQMAFFFSAGQGFSMPSPEETLLPEGNVNSHIRNEKGWQIEAGSRLAFFDKRLEIDATWYRIWLSDLLITKRITEDIFTGINAGRTNHAGIEIAMRSRILRLKHFPGSLDAVISYTNSENRFNDFTDNGISYKNKELPGIPSDIFSFQSIWRPVEWIGLYFDLRYDGRQFLNDANTLKYGSYYLMNTRITLDFAISANAAFSFYAGINNLNNREYASMLIVNAIGFGSNEPRYYYPGLPRNGYAGISISF
jgi:iron complex outermembrane receptor protein